MAPATTNNTPTVHPPAAPAHSGKTKPKRVDVYLLRHPLPQDRPTSILELNYHPDYHVRWEHRPQVKELVDWSEAPGVSKDQSKAMHRSGVTSFADLFGSDKALEADGVGTATLQSLREWAADQPRGADEAAVAAAAAESKGSAESEGEVDVTPAETPQETHMAAEAEAEVAATVEEEDAQTLGGRRRRER